HDGSHVGEIAIDDAGNRDDIADALHRLAQNIVRDAERLEEARAMLDAPALYALGEAYCAKNLKNACLSYMYVALSSARNTGNAALATQIKTSLAAQGVTAK
ncbi:MAG TPA: hypothetical protein VGU63_03805, partial [Candidatus Acidoferrales bacterium]|nr:hypothetical protein [Candidatus Acidoferrales bacterium]